MCSETIMYYHHYYNQPLLSNRYVLCSSPMNSLPIHHCSNNTLFNGGGLWLKAKVITQEKNSDFRGKCSSKSEQTTAQVSKEDVHQEEKQEFLKGSETNDDEIKKRVEDIRMNLESDEGEKSISISAYGTAWVAMVEDVNGSGKPQFPRCLEWIVENQLCDGSWGDPRMFVAYDRLLSTLASVIVLTHYNLHPHKAQKGLEFLKENLNKLETEKKEHMTCGFETILPSLLHLANIYNIHLPLHSPALTQVFASRDAKLKRIPMEVVHRVPTSLLFSLESFEGLQWEKLIKLQSKDGSFLFSPSSTAFAFIQTKDQNCLNYLNNLLHNFNGGGVPDLYPIEMYEQLWIVDRLARLGVSRYFQAEIKEMMDYVYRNWNEKGIGWTKYSDLPDLDNTSMGFRLLRFNGYEVSANVFKNFEKDGEFYCFAGQSDESTTVMFNFYRATQLQFLGEKILNEGKKFSTNFLIKNRAANQILDKWTISKDIPGEVGYALELPWYASLPRIETRFYLEQYGGADDVWISKILYRVHKVSNNTNLELGKLDYNRCQALHCREWKMIQEWYSECGLQDFGVSKEELLLAYFVAAASIFEPQRSKERFAWLKTCTLLKAFSCKYSDQQHRKHLVHEFNNTTTSYLNELWLNKNKNKEGLLGTLIETLYYFSQTSPTPTFDVLYDTWKKWLLGWENEGDKWEGEAELIVNMININGGYQLSHQLQLNPQYQRLLQLTNQLCHQLSALQNNKENHMRSTRGMNEEEIELKMQELVQLVLSSDIGIDLNMKKTFLSVTKAFYYTAYCDAATISSHIQKVLFERVI